MQHVPRLGHRFRQEIQFFVRIIVHEAGCDKIGYLNFAQLISRNIRNNGIDLLILQTLPQKTPLYRLYRMGAFLKSDLHDVAVRYPGLFPDVLIEPYPAWLYALLARIRRYVQRFAVQRQFEMVSRVDTVMPRFFLIQKRNFRRTGFDVEL